MLKPKFSESSKNTRQTDKNAIRCKSQQYLPDIQSLKTIDFNCIFTLWVIKFNTKWKKLYSFWNIKCNFEYFLQCVFVWTFKLRSSLCFGVGAHYDCRFPWVSFEHWHSFIFFKIYLIPIKGLVQIVL